MGRCFVMTETTREMLKRAILSVAAPPEVPNSVTTPTMQRLDMNREKKSGGAVGTSPERPRKLAEIVPLVGYKGRMPRVNS